MLPVPAIRLSDNQIAFIVEQVETNGAFRELRLRLIAQFEAISHYSDAINIELFLHGHGLAAHHRDELLLGECGLRQLPESRIEARHGFVAR